MDIPVLQEQPNVSLNDVPTGPYVPDGSVDGTGLVLLSAAGVAAGVVTGLAFGYASQWFYAIILFPILIGMVVGAMQKCVVRWVKIRNTLASGLAGLIAGMSAVVAMHYVDYEYFQRERTEVAAEWQEFYATAEQDGYTPAEIAEIRQEYKNDPEVISMQAVDSFPSYVDWSARQGVELSSTRSSGAESKPTNLGYVGSYIYWALDALIIAAMTIYFTRDQAAMPFCTECNRWKEEVVMGRLVANPRLITHALQGGHLSELSTITYGTRHLSELSLHLCGQCQDSNDLVVQVKEITYNKGQEVKSDKGRFRCAESAVEELNKLFEAAAGLNGKSLDAESEQLLAASNEAYANA